jgi:type II secretory pathway pseudopilin PulG
VRRTSAGISYIELLFVLALLGILAAVAAPRLQMGAVAKQTARTFARQITADLRYTRQLALTHAAGNPQGFDLVMNGSGSYSGYSIRNRQTGAIVQTSPISPDIQCTGGSTFSFGPLGNLLTGSATALQAGAGDETYSITVISATGTVLCQKNP